MIRPRFSIFLEFGKKGFFFQLRRLLNHNTTNMKKIAIYKVLCSYNCRVFFLKFATPPPPLYNKAQKSTFVKNKGGVYFV